MDAITKTNELFSNQTELTEDQIMPVIGDALAGSDDGELFLEESHSESLVFDDGRMKASNYDRSMGFGLRGISGEAHGYAHSDEMTIAAIKRAANTIRTVSDGYDGHFAIPPKGGHNTPLYTDENPLEATDFNTKV